MESDLPFPLEEGFTIYGKKSCPYCVKAYSLLNSSSYLFTYIDLGRYENGREEIRARSGHRTVPVVYYDGELVGGYSDLPLRFRF